jgi:hypothetical protein
VKSQIIILTARQISERARLMQMLLKAPGASLPQFFIANCLALVPACANNSAP